MLVGASEGGDGGELGGGGLREGEGGGGGDGREATPARPELPSRRSPPRGCPRTAPGTRPQARAALGRIGVSVRRAFGCIGVSGETSAWVYWCHGVSACPHPERVPERLHQRELRRHVLPRLAALHPLPGSARQRSQLLETKKLRWMLSRTQLDDLRHSTQEVRVRNAFRRRVGQELYMAGHTRLSWYSARPLNRHGAAPSLPYPPIGTV
jgi:hypothetical protein